MWGSASKISIINFIVNISDYFLWNFEKLHLFSQSQTGFTCWPQLWSRFIPCLSLKWIEPTRSSVFICRLTKLFRPIWMSGMSFHVVFLPFQFFRNKLGTLKKTLTIWGSSVTVVEHQFIKMPMGEGYFGLFLVF